MHIEPVHPKPSMAESRRRRRRNAAVGLGLISVGACLVADSWQTLHARVLVAHSSGVDWSELPPPPASSAPQSPEPEESDELPATLEAQRDALLQRMQAESGLDLDALRKVREIFEASPVLGQGNPKTTTHPMSRAECRRRRSHAGVGRDRGNPICGSPHMVPVYDPGAAGQTEVDAAVCIDQYEFPDIPCEYPVVYVRAREAAELCAAVDKRICDAHEWEGSCAGALEPIESEYDWSRERIEASYAHNKKREIVWAYGANKDHTLCATTGHKNPQCFGGEWSQCGSNTFPTGAFPYCVSRFGVYDQHGNAAEHMNLALKADQLASRGGVGSTEMKGSWFIFASYEAHEDDCRWRALDWHGSKLMDPNSHRNYHLGFRCCKDIQPLPLAASTDR
jgi:formylglycine-generating enzyme